MLPSPFGKGDHVVVDEVKKSYFFLEHLIRIAACCVSPYPHWGRLSSFTETVRFPHQIPFAVTV